MRTALALLAAVTVASVAATSTLLLTSHPSPTVATCSAQWSAQVVPTHGGDACDRYARSLETRR